MLSKEDIVGIVKAEDSEEKESTLWLEYKLGNSKAFEKIYRRYSTLLYNYGRHLNNEHELVKDCLQELFADLWSNREKVSDVGNVKSYLFCSFRRRVIDEAVRRRKFIGEEALLSNSDFEITFSHETFLINDQFTSEQKQSILTALNSLSVRQREAIYLKFYDKLSFNEIASVMSIHIDSVYNILSKAITTLRKVLKKATLALFPFFALFSLITPFL
jgi:RNA polymerase sigma factor (sigma-70 family)